VSAQATTVLVLAGGDSPERDVSLDSARGISEALRQSGYRVLVADPARPEVAPGEDGAEIFRGAAIDAEPPELDDDPTAARAEFARVLSGWRAYGVDVVFNALHGGAGEDGTLQAVMEYLGIPFTGSGALASALAMDKSLSKRIAAAAGVPVTRGERFERSALSSGTLEQTVRETLRLPVVVKPNAQGSSVGLSVVEKWGALEAAAAKAFKVDRAILVEEYVAGREITQACLEGAPDLPLLEIRPQSGLYDYFHKYQKGGSEYLVPAPVEPAVAAAIARSAQATFAALGLAVYARIDFRLDDGGHHLLLEANTLPGMTATSLVPKSCSAAGISYVELVDRIVKRSLER